MSAQVVRQVAPSGNRDGDYFYAVCEAHEWAGAFYSNRTVEGRTLADRDAAAHNRARHQSTGLESGHG